MGGARLNVGGPLATQAEEEVVLEPGVAVAGFGVNCTIYSHSTCKYECNICSTISILLVRILTHVEDVRRRT